MLDILNPFDLTDSARAFLLPQNMLWNDALKGFLQHAIYIAYNRCSSRQLDALERRKAIHKEVKKIPS